MSKSDRQKKTDRKTGKHKQTEKPINRKGHKTKIRKTENTDTQTYKDKTDRQAKENAHKTHKKN